MQTENIVCSRMFAIISTSMVLIMGLIGLIISAWMLSATNYPDLFNQQTTALCILMLIISIIMILLAGFGIWGAYKLNPNYLSAFWGVLFACALFLIVVGVLGIVFPKRIKVKGCGSTYYSSIGAMNETATRAVKAICQNCTCFYNITNSSAPVSAYNINSTDPSLPTRAQMCTNWTSTKWDDIMATLERDFSCASWCPGTLGVIYLMSNVNYGIPSRPCFTAVLDWYQQFCKRIAIPAFIFAALIVLILAGIWWNLCQIVDANTAYILQATGRSAMLNNTQYQLPSLPLPLPQPIQPRYQTPPPQTTYTQQYQTTHSNINSLAEINPYMPYQNYRVQ